MKKFLFLLATCWLAGAGCVANKPASSTRVASVHEGCEELTQPDFLFAVLRYLYRWHVDAETFLPRNETGEIEVWARSQNVKTDEGDHSQFAELWLPGAKLLVELKRANHEVPERNLVTQDSRFKIRSVEREDSAPKQTTNWTVLRFPTREIYAHLFQTRREKLFPDAVLEARLKAALVNYLHEQREHELMGGAQTFYAAPISSVCNELWIFWENQHVALRFTTDGDLADPQLWEQQAFNLREVSLKQNVTVSPEEASDGGRFVSRDWAGRLLYNCIVLGRKFTLIP